ncbi:hypothetical protein EAG_14769 [Camponotus floridanus]|uniref:Uncharacterized protein n=1 Tax=Camponotus floridanus TaxID=104421 RepID=E2A559_CAMFO|nr:hypothetical protein EAG_14769 [Camponotus floridanus]
MRFHGCREEGVTSESYEESVHVVHDDDDDEDDDDGTDVRLPGSSWPETRVTMARMHEARQGKANTDRHDGTASTARESEQEGSDGA